MLTRAVIRINYNECDNFMARAASLHYMHTHNKQVDALRRTDLTGTLCNHSTRCMYREHSARHEVSTIVLTPKLCTM